MRVAFYELRNLGFLETVRHVHATKGVNFFPFFVFPGKSVWFRLARDPRPTPPLDSPHILYIMPIVLQ